MRAGHVRRFGPSPVSSDTLTFAAPVRRFEQMVRNKDESFLITASRQSVSSRFPQR
jgi:hypothetical protein